MLTLRPNTCALLALLSLPAGATDYTVEYGNGAPPEPISGRLNDDAFLGDVDPIFHRPYESGGTCANVGSSNDYRYDTITVINIGNDEANVDLEIDTGFCDNAHDSIVFGYSGVFAPDDPLANCVIAGDDTLNPPTRCSRIRTALASNQTIVFVVTSYEPQTWPWTAKFNDRLHEDDFECLSADDFNCSGSP